MSNSNHPIWGERVEQVNGYRVGERVVVRPEDPAVRRSFRGSVRGTIRALWEDGAAHVEIDGLGILACGTSALRKVLKP